jgi:hypothetical protein
MAANDSTSVKAGNVANMEAVLSARIAAQKRDPEKAKKATGADERKRHALIEEADEAADRIDENMPVALALADALKMLSAPAHAPDGSAAANVTRSVLAAHLAELIEQIELDTKAIRAVAFPG